MMGYPVKTSLSCDGYTSDQDQAQDQEMKKHDNDDHITTGALIIAGTDFGMEEGCEKQAVDQRREDEADVSEGCGHRKC